MLISPNSKSKHIPKIPLNQYYSSPSFIQFTLSKPKISTHQLHQHPTLTTLHHLFTHHQPSIQL
nr:hypothetical protein [Bacillus sp. WP8]